MNECGEKREALFSSTVARAGQLWSSREGFKSRLNLGRPTTESSRRHSPASSKLFSWPQARRADDYAVFKQLCCVYFCLFNYKSNSNSLENPKNTEKHKGQDTNAVRRLGQELI